GRPTPEDFADALVLVVLQPELIPRLVFVRRRLCALHGVGNRRGLAHAVSRGIARVAHAVTLSPTKSPTSDANSPKPSTDGPVNVSTACSGCGMTPTTVPATLVMPAISRYEPLGLSPRYR